MAQRAIVGAAIFDNPRSFDPSGHCPGYRCLPGQSPVRIGSIDELPTNARWLTNVEVDIAKLSRAHNSPKLLNDRFLRVKTSSIIGELGLKTLSGADQAHVVAGIFDNLMQLTSSIYKIDEPPMYSLITGIPSAIGHFQPTFPSDIMEISELAFQTWTDCHSRVPDNSVFTSVVLPRVSHAKYLFESRLPWGPWRHVASTDLPLEKLRPSWVIENDLPCMAEITINKVSPKYGCLLSYATGAGTIPRSAASGGTYKTLNTRSWATAIEIDFLSRIADITIHRAIISDDELSQRYILPGSDSLSRLSYAYGLLCENLWISLECNADGKRTRTPLTAWVHSMDRMACMQKAAAFMNAGIDVVGYGLGRVTLAVPPDKANLFHRLCIDQLVIPQAGILRDLGLEEVRADIPAAPSSEQLLVGLHVEGRVRDITNIDNQITQKLCSNQGAR